MPSLSDASYHENKPARNKGLLPSVLALLIWGSWAGYANIDFGQSKALYAFLVQGFASFATTMVLTSMVNILYHRFKTRLRKILIPPLISSGSLISFHGTCNWLAGTPALLATIIPPFILGSLYCIYCAINLDRKDNPH